MAFCKRCGRERPRIQGQRFCHAWECRVQRLADNIRTRLTPEGECLTYRGNRVKGGYGLVGSYLGGGKSQTHLAHRVIYEATHGPIPEGMYVCHRCDNPPCCNVEHLFLGTAKQNMADMRAKGRGPEQKNIYTEI